MDETTTEFFYVSQGAGLSQCTGDGCGFNNDAASYTGGMGSGGGEHDCSGKDHIFYEKYRGTR